MGLVPVLTHVDDLPDVAASSSALRRFLHGLPGVDQVGVEARVADLATRSIKREAKRFALDLAVSMVDLTTLEGADTPGKVKALCAKGREPDPGDPSCPRWRRSASIPIASRSRSRPSPAAPSRSRQVATAFPSGRAALPVKLADVRTAVDAGADEIDMVIDRAAFLAGHYEQVLDEIVAVKEACGTAHLKVIFETGELVTLDNVRRVSWLAMIAGADFIKTSTGKVVPAATPPVVLVMLQAVRDFHELTGREVGVKPAGGMRTAKEAVRYLVMVHEEAGPRWLTPNLFRFGASSLLNDILMQRRKQASGHYASPYDVTLD